MEKTRGPKSWFGSLVSFSATLHILEHSRERRPRGVMRKRHRKGSKKPLSDQMRQAARLWYEGLKLGQIAAEIGIHRTTLWRWAQRADFQREINRISDRDCRERRRKWLKEYHASPEYKQAQRKRYYYRRKLPALEKKMAAAGKSGNMRAYAAATKEYNRCFNEAYFGGRTAAEILRNFHY